MAKNPENKRKIPWPDLIVGLATQGKLTPDAFSSLLNENIISPVIISILLRKNLLTPKHLIIWFSSYLNVPSDPRATRPYCPLSTITEALMSEDLVEQITPEDFGKLVTIHHQLLEAGRYICDSIGHDDLSSSLERVRDRKGFRTVAIRFEQMPKARRAR